MDSGTPVQIINVIPDALGNVARFSVQTPHDDEGAQTVDAQTQEFMKGLGISRYGQYGRSADSINYSFRSPKISIKDFLEAAREIGIIEGVKKGIFLVNKGRLWVSPSRRIPSNL